MWTYWRKDYWEELQEYVLCEEKCEQVKFGSNINLVVECVPGSFRLIVLGDLNGKVGCKREAGVM